MDVERNAILTAFADSKNLLAVYLPDEPSKNNHDSEKIRLSGNEQYRSHRHDSETHEKIAQTYSHAISLATPNSEEQALGYANRSALLYHLKKYQECIVDVDRAASITKSWDFKAKWVCRKSKCLVKIGDSKAAEKTLDEAKEYLAKVRDAQKKKDVLQMIQTCETFLATEQSEKTADNTHNKAKINKDVGDFEAVRVNYNSKYGRFLVANRHLKPGEVVLVEELYVSLPVNGYIYCSYCFVTCWNTIPCNYCWMMFCSEKCKTDAWNEYHDVECSIFSSFDLVGKSFSSLINVLFSLRLVIRECRKAGGIEKLREILEAADNSNDNPFDNFTDKQGKPQVHEFLSVYGLCSDVKLAHFLKFASDAAVGLLVSLAKSTSFFGKKFGFDEITSRKFIMAKDTLFIGSLLLKFIKMTFVCGLCNVSQISISIFHSLINHSCNPNVNSFFTEDNKIVTYALQPIEKNSQIFISYRLFNFYEEPIFERQTKIAQKFGFDCECEACNENWQPLMHLSAHLGQDPYEYFIRSLKTPLEVELFKKHQDIIIKINRGDIKNIHFNENMISDLAKFIEIVSKKLDKPSLVIYYLMQALQFTFLMVYSDFPQILFKFEAK